MDSNSVTTFVQDFIDGKAGIHDIDNYVDTWHNGNDSRTLHGFLGLTESEYELYMHAEMRVLENILRRKKLKGV